MSLTVWKKKGADTVHLNKHCQGAGDMESIHVCMTCAKPLVRQSRIYRKSQDVDSKEFLEYKKGKKRTDEEPPTVKVTDSQMKFINGVFDLVEHDFNYVKVFISKDGSMLGLKPARGADVDGECLSVKGGSMSFSGINSDIDVDLGVSTYRPKRFEVEWDENEEILVIDFSNAINQ